MNTEILIIEDDPVTAPICLIPLFLFVQQEIVFSDFPLCKKLK